jgi:hypothetical protein
VVLVLRILERFGHGYAHPARSILGVAEDGSLSPVVVPLQTDAVCVTRDDQVVDLLQRRKLVLEGVIGQGQSHRKEDRAADEILALVEREFLPAQISRYYKVHKRQNSTHGFFFPPDLLICLRLSINMMIGGRPLMGGGNT